MDTTINNNTHRSTLLGIEAMRGVAALLVVFYHISRHFEKNFGFLPLGSITEIGHIGVDFFFTLSGFIIYFIHYADIGHKNKWYPYAVKRISRVYPFYWFMCLMTLILVPFTKSATFLNFTELLSNFILWPLGNENFIIGVAWTLHHEILFYLFFSILILSKKIGTYLIFIWLILLILQNIFGILILKETILLSAYNLQFFMGVASAYILIKTKVSIPKTMILIGLSIIVFSCVAELFNIVDKFSPLLRLTYGLGSALTIIGIVSKERDSGLVVPPILRLFGSSSYSIYLTHLFFNGIIFKILLALGVIALFPKIVSLTIIIMITVILSILTSKNIEIPLSKKLKKQLLKLKPVSFQNP